MGSSPITPAAYWRLVRGNPNFRRLWLAQVVSEIGDWFYSLAIYSLLFELTGRAEAVGLAVVLQVLPHTFIAPASGAVIDRASRKGVMIAADLVRAAIVLGMLLVRTREIVWLVYPLLLVETLGAAFFEPARNSVIPNITPSRDVIVANTLSSTTWSFNLAVGATLGGAVAALLGRDAVFVLNALSFLSSAALVARMRFTEPHLAGAPALRFRDLADFSPFFEGLRYIRSDPRLLATVFVKAGIGVMGSNNVILPILGQQQFAVGVDGLDARRAGMLGMSLLMGSRGAGALLGPLLSARWAGHSRKRLRSAILIGFLFAAAGYVSLGLAPAMWLGCAAIVLAHMGGSTNWVFSTTLLQLQTDDRFRGRVFATDLSIAMLTISASSYLAGSVMDSGIPARLAAMSTGAAMLVPAAAWLLALRLWKRPNAG
jgi:MFS family permease